MKLHGFGPWGVEEVSRAVGASVRALQHWHERGWAKASAATAERGCLRYQREDLPRLCLMAAMRADNIGAKRAVKLCEDIDRRLANAVHHVERPHVFYGPIAQ